MSTSADDGDFCGFYPLDGKPINLALQGGGAHGAFTWGVLDRLLEDGRVGIEAISGTSAGAMNAVVLANGLMQGGRDGAREALQEFWWAVSEASMTSPFKRTAFDMLIGNWNLDWSPSYFFFDALTRVASPYQLNPLNINPLRDLVERQVDFERVRRCNRVKLFISATSVRTGRVRVFRSSEVTLDAVMASACLPFLFQAVEVDGEPYWDGGYMGNPVLYPFFYTCTSPDVMLVQINPFEIREAPKTAPEIMDRVNEITFNSSLLAEFRAIDFVTRLIDEGRLEGLHHKRVLVHMVTCVEVLQGLSVSSKFNGEWAFLTWLRDVGRASAEDWLGRHYDDIGVRPTLDTRACWR